MLPPLRGCACALAARRSAATAPAARSAKRLLSGLIMVVLLPPVLELSPAVHAGPSFRGRPVRDCRLADGTGEIGRAVTNSGWRITADERGGQTGLSRIDLPPIRRSG